MTLPFKGAIYPFNESGFTSAINQTETIDFGSINTAAQEVSQVTVTGAALGDAVVVTAKFDTLDLLIWGYVSAADTVEVVASNLTGGAVDLPSGDFVIKVLGME